MSPPGCKQRWPQARTIPSPAASSSTSSTRVSIERRGDYVSIMLDKFHDERNGYRFAVNPAGAKWDAQIQRRAPDQRGTE